jgi:hypothetical protein
MKKTLTLAFALVALVSASIAQDKSTVIFFRDTGYNWGGAFRIFADDKLICQINNKRFSSHQFDVGEHFFAAQAAVNTISDKSREQAIKINLQAGKTYYVAVVIKQGLLRDIFCEEITESSWQKRKAKLKEETNCDQ